MNFKLFKSTKQSAKVIAFNSGLFPVTHGDYLVYRNGSHISQYSSLILCHKGKQIAEIKKEGKDYRNPALAPDGTVFFLDFTGHYLDGYMMKNQYDTCRLMCYKNGNIKTISKDSIRYYSPYGKAYKEKDTYIISVYDKHESKILKIKNNTIISDEPKGWRYNETAIFKYLGKWYGLARKGDLGVDLLNSSGLKIKEITNLDHPADICKVGSQYIAAIGGRSGVHGNIRVFKGSNPLEMWDNETDYYIGDFDDFGYPTIKDKTIYFYGRHPRFGYLLFLFRID